MKEIDRETMKTGDIVGVPQKVHVGFGNFRYEKIIPMKVKKVTPAKTKVIIENGLEYDRYQRFYELDEDAQHQTHVAECAERLNNDLYELNELKRKGLLFRMNDEIIVAISEALDKAIEISCKN